MSFSLEKIVEKPTWKVILLDLISSKQLDPWNIDLVVVTDSFIKKVKEMEELDFFIPANLILAASILLRYKSEKIRFHDDLNADSFGNMDEFLPDVSYVPDSIPDLAISSRIPPKRQITLNELMQEIEKAIKYETNDKRLIKSSEITEFVDLNINQFDIEKKMEEILFDVKENVDSEGLALFSRLVRGKKSIEVIYSLLSLLHLTQKEKLDLYQDELFGEIFIRLKSPA
ncbi:MAG TPA: segregation/condensation protein A [Candidatus Bilamarchaeaceae archaeon]|nr:segregation/condensation protein A [Candidatus Bilamarchaeaceae archaeon]